MNNVELYHKTNIHQKETASKYLEEYDGLVKRRADAFVLDIGCGDGSITTTIIEKYVPRCKKLIGCDINGDMIRFAEEHYATENVQFTVLDIQGDLPEQLRGSFDNVFSFFTLHWVPQQEIAFKNIYDLLKEDGNFFAMLVAQHALYDGYRALAKVDKWKPWLADLEKYVSPYQDSQDPIKQMSQLLRTTGFKIIKIDYQPISFEFENQEQIKEKLKSLVPFKIPKAMLDEFVVDLVEEIHKSDTQKYNFKKSTYEFNHNLHAIIFYVEKQ